MEQVPFVTAAASNDVPTVHIRWRNAHKKNILAALSCSYHIQPNAEGAERRHIANAIDGKIFLCGNCAFWSG
jgi:hypothetical protein